MEFKLTDEQFESIRGELVDSVKGELRNVVYSVIDEEVDVRDIVYEIISDKLTDSVDSEQVINEVISKLDMDEVKQSVTSGILKRISWNNAVL